MFKARTCKTGLNPIEAKRLFQKLVLLNAADYWRGWARDRFWRQRHGTREWAWTGESGPRNFKDCSNSMADRGMQHSIPNRVLQRIQSFAIFQSEHELFILHVWVHQQHGGKRKGWTGVDTVQLLMPLTVRVSLFEATINREGLLDFTGGFKIWRNTQL